MDGLPENIVYIVLKLSREGLTTEEQNELDRWVSENGDQEINLLKEYASLAHAADRFAKIDTEAGWQEVEQQTSSVPGWRSRRVWHYWSVAAGIVLLLSLGYYLFTNQQREDLPIETAQIMPGTSKAVWEIEGGERYILNGGEGSEIIQEGVVFGKDSIKTLVIKGGDAGRKSTISVPVGGEYRIVLSDGTKVWLNSNSELIFPTIFTGESREVTLKGEAYFDVVSDKNCPFIVRTNNSDIRVFGTVFNVCSYDDDSFEEITLVSGKVEVASNDKLFSLKPGEQFRLSEESREGEVKSVDVRLYTSWVEGMFRFQDMPLDELTVKLRRWYDVNFVFANDACKRYRFTGAIWRDVNFEEFIHLIERTTNVQFVVNQKNIVILEK